MAGRSMELGIKGNQMTRKEEQWGKVRSESLMNVTAVSRCFPLSRE